MDQKWMWSQPNSVKIGIIVIVKILCSIIKTDKSIGQWSALE